MNSIPKFVSSVVVFMIAVLVCVSIIYAGIMVTTSKTHHNNVISKIEESRFDETVITECVETAKNKGFLLTVSKQLNISSVEHYKVVLYYDVSLPLFGKVHTGKWIGYAYPGASIASAEVGPADHYFEIDSNGVLGIKATYRWATGLDNYASDNGKTNAGSKNALLPSEIVIPTYFDGVKVKSLREDMFAGNTSLTKISFEEGVGAIGARAFQNCSNLSGDVVFPDSLLEIKENAFENCSGVTTMEFKESSSLATIGDYAFLNCAGLTDVTLPDSMTKNGYAAFKGCNNMTSYKAPFVGASPTGTKKSGGYIGYIFGAEDEDYESHNTVVPSGLETVHITSYVTDYSCYDMDQLKNLLLGKNIVSFEMWPFAYCDGLTSVTIPKSVLTTKYAAFLGCTKLTTVTFEEGSTLSVLGASNFTDCTKLATIKIPDTVKEIGAYCFENCDSLTFDTAATGKIPNGVVTIGEGAFSYCDSSSFTTLEIPATVTTVEPRLCTRSTNVKKITVAGGTNFKSGVNGELLTYDGAEIVQYPYASSTSYVVPDSVRVIRDQSFYYTRNLESIDFSKATKLTTIGSSAFSQCGNITSSITLPDSVTLIDDYAFYHAGKWAEFTMGSKVARLGTYAFYDAGGIGCKYYLLMTTAPTLGSNVFFCNTVTSGTITKFNVYVQNKTVLDAFVNGTHYDSDYCTVGISV